jgi:dienelactone hydrolase
VVPSAAAEELSAGTSARSVFDHDGPYETTQTAKVRPCDEGTDWGRFTSAVVRTAGNRTDLTCTRAFPNGTDSPAGLKFYYPSDIADLDPLPALIWVPGITGDPGNYDFSARRWASYGFVVVIAYNFINSDALTTTYVGAAALAARNRDRDSPLYHRVDLSRTVVGGHSAGGGSTLQAASVPQQVNRLIDPRFRVISAVPTEPGPVAIGSTVRVPTLLLTGCSDTVVPDQTWPRITQYPLITAAPAYIGCARGATHFTPVDGHANTFLGITAAWLLYTAKADPTAAQFFVGDDWLFRTDPDFDRVQRNARADTAT